MSGIAKLGGTLGAALLAGLLIPGSPATPSAQAQAPQAPTFTKDVLPILQRSCQKCHRPGHGRADVAPHLSGGAAVGARDPAARLDAADAAVAHRPQHRRVHSTIRR